MIGIDNLVVSISLDGVEIDLGELLHSEKRIYFKYYTDFIDKGIEISPFKMRLSEKILFADQYPFEGLFGVFNDSLPDGWGRLLLDRKLYSIGISPNQISPLDRLAYVGQDGMGALIYRPAIESDNDYNKRIELDNIAAQMNNILEGTSSDVIEELFDLGGSSGGARPKIFVGYNPYTDHIIHGKELLPDDYEHWIIKFPSSADPVDIANIEYSYYQMALDSGIEMNDCNLFVGKSGKNYFGTKRFDRKDGNRIHLHSASGIMHDNFRLSNMDYGHLMDCTFQLERHVAAYEKILRLAAFNVYSNNRDDHSKNVSFLMNHSGAWRLAPAYDLTFSNSSHGMHSTMIAGESKVPGRKHLLELAKHFSVRSPDEIIERVQHAVSNWSKYAIQNGVRKHSLSIINKAISQTKD